MSTVSSVVAQQQRAAAWARAAPAVNAAARHRAATPGSAAATASATASAMASAIVSLGGAKAQAAAAPTYTDRIKRSGNASVDALLAGGKRWFHDSGASGEVPSATAQRAISYSFITSAEGLNATDARGFQPLDGAQQQRVRDALAVYAGVINVSFSEVASGGDIQYGANRQANSAGYARYPGEGAQVMLASNQSSFAGAWETGSYAWEVLLHETGHALGLKHPGNYNAGGGGTAGPYLAAAADNRSNTLMSYNDAASMKRVVAQDGGLSRVTVNPGGLQAYDIAALQYLYGAAQGGSARSYSFDTDAVMSTTLWNPNDGSAIDLSNQSRDNTVDLRAGRKSSIALRDAYADTGFTKAQYNQLMSGGRKISALLGTPGYTGQGNLTLAAGSRFTQATGGSGNDSFVANDFGDRISGGAGDDRVFWTGGNLAVDGGEGRDTVLVKKLVGGKWTLSGDQQTLTLTQTNAKTKEVTTLGTISLSGVESVRYWDGTKLAATGAAIYTAPA